MSASLGTDLSLRPDNEVGQYLYSSLAIIDTDGFPHNRSLVGALELLQIHRWKDPMREGTRTF